MQVSVTARTPVSEEQKERATTRLEALESLAQGPVLAARVRLRHDGNPSIEKPYHAEGELDVNGRLVRAHAAGPSTEAAIDALADRLERQLRRRVDRRIASRHENGSAEAGAWRHGSLPTERKAFFPRPAAERRVMRTKSFAAAPMTVEEAAADLLDLDHLFYLFHDVATDQDAVIHRLRDDGRFGLIERNGTPTETDERWLIAEPDRLSGPMTVDQAIEHMNTVERQFMYFINSETDRGSVIYLRYDGHYGLIELS